MMIKGTIKKGEYYDSVSLMIVSKDINKLDGIIDSSVVMGTKENLSILKVAGLFVSEFETVSDTDLLISLKAESEEKAKAAVEEIGKMLKALRNKTDNALDFQPKSFENALKQMPDANLSLISIAGKYAAQEAWKALKKGVNVMLFSDNVSLNDELELKRYAVENQLLVMGPDCGTAIINGTPLAFANVVNSGNIGIVAASGTGLQEVSSIISNNGAGISQAIGTGGRDVKKEIGGLMFLEAMKALNNDRNTEIIVLISKPPHETVIEKIATEIKKIKKPVVGILIGGNPETIRKAGAYAAHNLEEAALMAVALSKKQAVEKIADELNQRNAHIKLQAQELSKNTEGKYLRGLFSGGTLCDETQLLLKNDFGFMYSNTPLNQDFKLENAWKSREHTILDLGDDEFTAGRPHPMIDFSLRKKKIVEEAQDPQVAVILLDVVLGYGSNLKPADELAPAIEQALKIAPRKAIICSITGTDNDPQNRKLVKEQLQRAGAIVMNTNVEASVLAKEILKNKK